jgi:hypothetical protein
MNSSLLTRQVLLYTILSILGAIGYAFLVSGLSLISGGILSVNNPLIIGFVIFGLALLFNPMRNRLQHLIDHAFFRGDQVYTDFIDEFNRSIDPSMELPEIGAKLRNLINKSLNPSQLHLFVLDNLRNQYIATPDESERPSTDIQFSEKSVIPEIISGGQDYL